jgi:hypothetical protein
MQVTAQDLENGNGELGLVGSLVNGSGKWRLQVASDVSLHVQSRVGRLTGLLRNISQTAN